MSSVSTMSAVGVRPGPELVGGWTRTRANWECAAFGLFLGLAVLGPLIGARPVFLLDWARGPHSTLVSSAALGLNGGLTTGILDAIGITALGELFGSAITWLVALAFFPIAAAGAGRLVGGSRWARLSAASLYTVNPFVFSRLYAGHLALLIGYALLPFAVASALRFQDKLGAHMLRPALWWAILTALSPHFAWIYGVVLVVVLVVRRPWSLRRLGWFVAVCSAFVVLSAYIVLPHEATQLPVHTGSTSLAIYRTAGDPRYGLFVNVLGLYGFWRIGPGPELPKQIVAGWPLLLLAILVVASVGAWYVFRRPKAPLIRQDVTGSPRSEPELDEKGRVRRQETALVILVSGAAGFFLSLGDQGPTGWLFSWAYYNVPFFQVMREPQKFLMLLALAYAVFLGWGVERLSQVDLSGKGSRIAAGTLGVALPLLYCPTIFWGLAGQISPSSLPSSYQRADALMGSGEGEILYLPWHLYMSYPFTDGRVIANLAPSSFRRAVISGDNIEVGNVETQSTSPRSAYIYHLLSDSKQLRTFGSLVAPLGVQFVVLAKTVDWASYHWLDHQTDLRRIYDSSSLEVWRNQDYDGVGVRVRSPVLLPTLEDLLQTQLPRRGVGGFDGGAVRIAGSSHAQSNSRTVVQSLGRARQVHELSPVAYRVPPGPPGWVTVDTTYQKGWVLDGRSAVATAEGTMMFRVGHAGGVARFGPWASVKLGYLIASFTFLVIVLVDLATRQRKAAATGES